MANPNQPITSPPQPQTPRVQYVEDFTVYELDFTGLASGGTANGAIQIQADSAFRWNKAAYFATIANAAFVLSGQPVPNVAVQIVDTGSGRQLFNASVPVPSVFGRGELPFILPVSRIFKERSSIAVTVTNFDAAVTYNLRLSFIGTKLFPYGN